MRKSAACCSIDRTRHRSWPRSEKLTGGLIRKQPLSAAAPCNHQNQARADLGTDPEKLRRSGPTPTSKEYKFMSTNTEHPDPGRVSTLDLTGHPVSGTSGIAPAPVVARTPLRIWPISDLHLANAEGWSTGHIPHADVAVIAGDVCEGVVAAVDWLAIHIRPHMPVVFVPGNHEFYGGHLPHALTLGKAAAAEANIHLLDDDAVLIGDVRFTGATLWTDYALHGEAFRVGSMIIARSGLNDHRRIAWSKQPWMRFRPEEAATLHHQSRLAIEGQLVQHRLGPTIAVTHHAPHPLSLPDKVKSSLLSAAYASDLTDLITRCGPDLWVHGHTHHAVDYAVGTTRIISNPRGYTHKRHATGFEPTRVVEV
jgi:UDP-2,3-diacylglucosamine pyrophosphatase LpxH